MINSFLNFNSILIIISILGIIIILPQGLLLIENDFKCQCEPKIEFFSNGFRKINNEYLINYIQNSKKSIKIFISDNNLTELDILLQFNLENKFLEGINIEILTTSNILSFSTLNYQYLNIPNKEIKINFWIFDNNKIYIPSKLYYNFENNKNLNNTNYALFIENCESIVEDLNSLFNYFWYLSINNHLNNIINLRKWSPDYTFPSFHEINKDNNQCNLNNNKKIKFLKFSLSPNFIIPFNRYSILNETINLFNNSMELKILTSSIFNNNNFNLLNILQSRSNLRGFTEFFICENDFILNYNIYKSLNWHLTSNFKKIKCDIKDSTIIIGDNWVLLYPIPISDLFNESIITLGITINDFMVLSEASFLFFNNWRYNEPINF